VLQSIPALELTGPLDGYNLISLKCCSLPASDLIRFSTGVGVNFLVALGANVGTGNWLASHASPDTSVIYLLVNIRNQPMRWAAHSRFTIAIGFKACCCCYYYFIPW